MGWLWRVLGLMGVNGWSFVGSRTAEGRSCMRGGWLGMRGPRSNRDPARPQDVHRISSQQCNANATGHRLLPQQTAALTRPVRGCVRSTIDRSRGGGDLGQLLTLTSVAKGAARCSLSVVVVECGTTRVAGCQPASRLSSVGVGVYGGVIEKRPQIQEQEEPPRGATTAHDL